MTTEPTNTVEAESPSALQVIDIENAVKAIDYASEQGAYKGWNTIQEVLTIRNKLVLFLQHAKAEIEAAQALEEAARASVEAATETVAQPTDETPAEGAQ